MKRILMVSSEAVPFAKTGGLADVVGSLPLAFDKEQYDVRVLMPKYGSIPKEYTDQMNFITHINVSLGWRNKYCGLFELNYKGTIFYFIDDEFYFGGEDLYGYIHQDVEKFSFFSKAALSVLPHLNFRPDIIHCHDWQTGLIPVFLNVQYQHDEFYRGIKTIMTIHNLKFQGVWGLDETQDATGLPEYVFTPDKLEFKKDANLLKGGIVYADHITTVSHTYKNEIQTPYYGEQLDGLLRARDNSLSGIVNGIDYEMYDPSNDDMIYAKFNRRDFPSRKKENKLSLQNQLGLDSNKGAFMIGLISRLTDQKGLDLVAYVMDRFADSEMQLVVLGTGDHKYEKMFQDYAWNNNRKISANITFSNDLAHKIYASADAFLMPSLFEPCGLSQMISMRYGTIPIVRETGGLKDTIIPYNQYTGEGTGFSFKNYNVDEMWDQIWYASQVYKDKTEWNNIARQAMSQDFSWETSAGAYAQLYSNLLGY